MTTIAVLSFGGLARAEIVSGASLPDGAQKVAELRYRTRGSFEDTMKHYKAVYPVSTYPRKNIANQPGVKAVHIVNPNPSKGWEGLNIYEANDEVRIYIVTAGESGKGKKPKRK